MVTLLDKSHDRSRPSRACTGVFPVKTELPKYHKFWSLLGATCVWIFNHINFILRDEKGKGTTQNKGYPLTQRVRISSDYLAHSHTSHRENSFLYDGSFRPRQRRGVLNQGGVELHLVARLGNSFGTKRCTCKGEVFRGYSYPRCLGVPYVRCCPLSHLTP